MSANGRGWERAWCPGNPRDLLSRPVVPLAPGALKGSCRLSRLGLPTENPYACSPCEPTAASRPPAGAARQDASAKEETPLAEGLCGLASNPCTEQRGKLPVLVLRLATHTLAPPPQAPTRGTERRRGKVYVCFACAPARFTADVEEAGPTSARAGGGGARAHVCVHACARAPEWRERGWRARAPARGGPRGRAGGEETAAAGLAGPLQLPRGRVRREPLLSAVGCRGNWALVVGSGSRLVCCCCCCFGGGEGVQWGGAAWKGAKQAVGLVPPALLSLPRALCCLWLLTETSLCRSVG